MKVLGRSHARLSLTCRALQQRRLAARPDCGDSTVALGPLLLSCNLSPKKSIPDHKGNHISLQEVLSSLGRIQY